MLKILLDSWSLDDHELDSFLVKSDIKGVRGQTVALKDM